MNYVITLFQEESKNSEVIYECTFTYVPIYSTSLATSIVHDSIMSIQIQYVIARTSNSKMSISFGMPVMRVGRTNTKWTV